MPSSRHSWDTEVSRWAMAAWADQGAFADQLPLELGQRREDAADETAGSGGGVDPCALAGSPCPQARHPFHQRGELRDRTGEGQHYRVAGLNLLAAIIFYWNTLPLGHAVFARREAGLEIPPEFLAHISPPSWEHINLTAEYRWPSTGSTGHAKRLT